METALIIANTLMPGFKLSSWRALRVTVETIVDPTCGPIDELIGESINESGGDPIIRLTSTRSSPFRAFATSVTVEGKMF